MRRTTTGLAVAVATAALLVGCSKSNETTTTASSTTTQAPATTPATEKPKAPGTTKPSNTGTTKKRTTVTTTGKGSDPDSEYCKAAKGVAEDFASYNDIDIMNDPAAFTKALGEAADASRSLQDSAPAEIRADWGTIADTFDKLAKADPDKLFDEMMKLGPEVDTAGKHIDAVTTDLCGFNVGASSSESSSGSSGSGGGDTSTSIDANKLSIDGAKAYLKSGYSGEAWLDKLTSWSVSTSGGSATIEVGPASAADAFAVCDALSSYAHQINEDATIQVDDADGKAIQVRKGVSGVCQAP